MARAKQLQTNFTAGIIDPLAAVREDVAFYYNGLEEGYNLLNIPQGGIRRRSGLEHVAELAPIMAQIDASGATTSGPQGGTHANVIDGDEATLLTTSSNLSTTDPFVIFHIDFGAAVDVLAVDIIDYLLSSGALEDELFIQYSTDNSSWINFGGAFNADTAARSRRIRTESTVTARYWRFVRVGSTDVSATVTVAEIKFYEPTSTVSEARLVPFAYSTDEAYMMLATDRNLDIFAGNSRVAAAGLLHTTSQLAILNWTQSLDTLLLFHKNVQIQRVFRQGSDDEFDFRKQEFSNIPQYDYGAGTGGVDEVQVINISEALDSSHKFTLLLDGERTTAINGDGTASTVASNIQTALRALNNTSASGITVSSVTDGYEVTFADDDGKQPWGLLSVSILAGNAVVDVARTTEGRYPGEDIMSDTRGWPRCGCIYQSRLHVGGIPGVPDALLSSALTGDYFNLDIELDDDTRALLTRSEADQISAIYQIVAGRHLSLFTNDGEFYIPQEPISAEAVTKLTTRAGSKEGLRIHEVDGALLFIQGVKDENNDREIGTSLREFIYVDTEQSYAAENISKLSAHLIKNPVDFAKRPAVSTDDADIMLIVNEDGTLTAQTTLRSDLVNAFIPQTTNGKFKNVGVDKKRRVYFVVERTINGVVRRFLEKWNENLLLDGGGIVTIEYEEYTATEGQTTFNWTFDNPAAAAAIGVRIDSGRLQPEDYTATLGTKTVELAEGVAAGTVVRIAKMIDQVAGLDHLESETVQTYVDGTQDVDVTVSGGVLDLGKYADTEIQYGFDFYVYGKLMPFRIPGEQGRLSGEKIRCHRAILSLYQTGGLYIRANGSSWREVKLLQLDSDIGDRSTMETLFTGEKEERGLMGAEIGGYLEFKQEGPDPLTIRGITRGVTF